MPCPLCLSTPSPGAGPGHNTGREGALRGKSAHLCTASLHSLCMRSQDKASICLIHTHTGLILPVSVLHYKWCMIPVFPAWPDLYIYIYSGLVYIFLGLPSRWCPRVSIFLYCSIPSQRLPSHYYCYYYLRHEERGLCGVVKHCMYILIMVVYTRHTLNVMLLF